jgi:hypothetical protein
MRIVLRNKQRRELLWGVVGIKLSIGENVVPIVLSFLAEVFKRQFLANRENEGTEKMTQFPKVVLF